MKALHLSTTASLLGLFFSLHAAVAQQSPEFYTKPIVPLLEKMPSLPLTVATAYKMGQVVKQQDEQHSLIPLASVSDYKKSLEQLSMEIRNNASSLDGMGGQGDSYAELAKKMEDPEFRKKLEAMSQEEQMAFAMKLQQSMTQDTKKAFVSQAEDEEVMEVVDRIGLIAYNLRDRVDQRSAAAIIREQVGKMQERVRQHDEKMRVWYEEEFKKLPFLPSDKIQAATNGKDPQQVKNLALNALNQRIAFMDEELKSVATHWAAELTKLEQALATADQEFASIEYFEQLNNKGNKAMLMNYQLQLLSPLIEVSEQLERLISQAGNLALQKQLTEQKPLHAFQ